MDDFDTCDATIHHIPYNDISSEQFLLYYILVPLFLIIFSFLFFSIFCAGDIQSQIIDDYLDTSKVSIKSLEDPFSMYGKIPIKNIIKLSKDQIKSILGKTCVIGGWVESGRKNKKIAFLTLKDGSCFESIQVVVESDITDNLSAIVKKDCSLMLSGMFIEPPEDKREKQSFEFHVKKILHIGECPPDGYPVPKNKDLTLEGLRSVPQFRSRTKTLGAMFAIRNALAMATHKFFQHHGFKYMHPPLITASDCEGAGEMFQVTTLLDEADANCKVQPPSFEELEEAETEYLKQCNLFKQMKAQTPKPSKEEISKEVEKICVLKKKLDEIKEKVDLFKGGGILRKEDGTIDYSKDFFAKPAYLAVSGQLDGESYACSSGGGKIYTFGPTFRAEPSLTSRHLAEFWMIEPEIAFCDLGGLMKCVESYVKFCIKYVLEECKSEMHFFNERIDDKCISRLTKTIEQPFAKLSYSDAITLLMDHEKEGHFVRENEEDELVTWGIDLRSEHERYLCETIYDKPLILFDYPSGIKAFYMFQNDDGKTVAAMDLLVPGIGELVGGSQREDRVSVLTDKIKTLGLDEEDYKSYVDIRRFGGVPHSGFGLGFERLIRYVTGLESIRDVIPYPRYYKTMC